MRTRSCSDSRHRMAGVAAISASAGLVSTLAIAAAAAQGANAANRPDAATPIVASRGLGAPLTAHNNAAGLAPSTLEAFPARHQNVPQPGSVIRNAVGMPTASETSRIQTRSVAPPLPHDGAVGLMPSIPGALHAPSNFASVPPARARIVLPPAGAPGRINGTSLIRPGSAPAGLGGPAKSAAGINGSTFRAKR